MKDSVIVLGKSMPVNEPTNVFRTQYLNNRYLSNLNLDELQYRLYAISQNLFIFDTSNGKLKINLHIDKNKIYKPVRNIDWLRLLIEVYEEYGIRNQPVPSLKSQTAVRDCEKKFWVSDWASRPDLIESPSPDSYEIPKRLFRYCKTKYNKDLLEHGLIRLSPALKYNDGALLSAQQDRETILEVASADGHFEVGNFHVVCFSSIYNYRMYCEFQSDSCIVINNTQEFQERFNRAVEEFNRNSTGPRISVAKTCPIIYYDSFNIEMPTIADEIYFTKPLQFAYQHEFRLIVLGTVSNDEKPIDLRMGPLHDIAELVAAPA